MLNRSRARNFVAAFATKFRRPKRNFVAPPRTERRGEQGS